MNKKKATRCLMTTKTKLKIKKQTCFNDSTSESSDNEIEYADSSNSDWQEENEEPMQTENFSHGDYVLVKFATKKSVLHFIGKILNQLPGNEFEIKILKKTAQNQYVYPDNDDIAHVDKDDIIVKLQPKCHEGTTRVKSFISFDVNLPDFV